MADPAQTAKKAAIANVGLRKELEELGAIDEAGEQLFTAGSKTAAGPDTRSNAALLAFQGAVNGALLSLVRDLRARVEELEKNGR